MYIENHMDKYYSINNIRQQSKRSSQNYSLYRKLSIITVYRTKKHTYITYFCLLIPANLRERTLFLVFVSHTFHSIFVIILRFIFVREVTNRNWSMAIQTVINKTTKQIERSHHFTIKQIQTNNAAVEQLE